MKDNGKSALKIKQIILILPVLIVLSTNIQLFVSTQNKKEEETNSIQQEEIKQSEIIYERTADTTSRSSVERNVTQENTETVVEKKYISIEEIEISKNMDLTIRCGISKEDFKELMKNLKSDTSNFFYDNSDTIYNLCEKYELNELFFCGLIAAESGWKISSSHRSACNYISMMSKGKLIRYSSEEEGLEAAAKLLHNKYLTPGGSYYTGKTLKNVQKRFCPNSNTWVNLVYGCMKTII